MPITKPYYRIWRPMKGYSYMQEFWNQEKPVADLSYLSDDLFVSQHEIKSQVITARVLIQDLYQLFNYIEPNDGNLNTFSYRVYELFLRATTEVESNCKAILSANNFAVTQNTNMANGYFKLEQALKLSEYKVTFTRWATYKEFKPFEAWRGATAYAPLPWYQSYNHVKHNRYANFQEANLENLMNAIAGLLCLLHAQVGQEMGNACFEGISFTQENQTILETETFKIIAPTFDEADQYEFIWETLKETPDPVLNYAF